MAKGSTLESGARGVMARPMARLRQQLAEGCGQQACRHVFCRPVTSPAALDRISDILARYDSLFLCSNISTLLGRTRQANTSTNGSRQAVPRVDQRYVRHPIIDIFFVLVGSPARSLVAAVRHCIGRLCGYKGVPKLPSAAQQSYPHHSCLFLQEPLCFIDRYIAIGVVHLLLAQFQQCPCLAIGLAALRLHSRLLSCGNDISEQYYPLLENVYAWLIQNGTACTDGPEAHSTASTARKTNPAQQTPTNYNTIQNNELSSSEINGNQHEHDKRSNEVATPPNSRLIQSSANTSDQHNREHTAAAQPHSPHMPGACIATRCLYSPTLTDADVDAIANGITHALETVPFDLRPGGRLHHLLSILRSLHTAVSHRGGPPRRFVQPQLCARANLRQEVRHYRTGQESLLNYPFIIPTHIKAEVLKIECTDTMKSQLQDAFFRAIFEGMVAPYLFMNVTRATVYSDTLRALATLCADDMRKQLKVRFEGEDGIDSGGIKKEYFQLLGEELARDKDLVAPRGTYVWLRPGASSERCRLAGVIIGLALYNGAVLGVPFPQLLFRRLCNGNANFEDLQDFEPETYRSVCNLGSCTAEELARAELFFTVDVVDQEETADGRTLQSRRLVELIPNGRNVVVSHQNLEVFKQALAEFHTTRAVEEGLQSLESGFRSVLTTDLLDILDPAELEKIIVGVKEVDVNMLEREAAYMGFSADSRIIRAFWAIFRAYSPEDQRLLLQFITGSDRLPVAGSLKLSIVRNGGDTERLPSTQTCFNTILLPEYASDEKLREKIDKAVRLTTGFYLL